MLQKWNKKIVVSLLAVAMVIAGCVAVIGSGISAKASDVIEANEVADGMLDVKMQVKENADGSVNMRLISSVNGLGYYRVGFEVYYDVDGSGTIEDKEGYIPLQTDKVLKRINAVNTGVTYNYSPKVVDTDAEYFITYTLMNISETLQGRDFYIRAYVIPLDNKTAKEYGTGRYFNIVEATSANVINIPVKVDAKPNTTADGKITDAVTVKVGSKTVNAVAYLEKYDENDVYGVASKYAHINLEVPTEATVDGSTKKIMLPSASLVSVGGQTAIYRNLETSYKIHKADTSWYDVYASTNTAENAFVIATDADLYGFSAKSASHVFTNQTVYLVADIDANNVDAINWTTGELNAGYENNTVNYWTPIGPAGKAFVGTFDGQEHSVRGIYYSTDKQYGGLFSYALATIKNFTLTNSYFKSSVAVNPCIGSVLGYGGGTIEKVYSDAKVETVTGMTAGGFVGYGGYNTLIMKKCWFDGDIAVNYINNNYCLNVGGFLGEGTKEAQFYDCMYTGDINATYTHTNTSASSKDFRVGGFIGRCSTNVTIQDCLSKGNVSAVWQKNSGLTYGEGTSLPTTITNVASLAGKVDGTVTTKNVYDFNVVTTQAGDSKATFITTAISGKTLDTTVLRLPEASLLGLDGCRYLALDFDKTWVAVEGSLPQLKTFAENPMDLNEVTSLVDYGWYSKGAGTTASPYVLNTAKDLYGLSFLSNTTEYSTVNSKIIQLAPNTEFVMNQGTVAQWKENNFTGLTNWKPIANFTGTFDGQGSTIKELYLSTSTDGAGLFAKSTGTIKNMSLEDSYLQSTATGNTAQMGSIVGIGAGKLENVYSNAQVNIAYGVWNGGLVGNTAGTLDFISCWFDGTVNAQDGTNYYPYVGGFVGRAGHKVTLTDCLYTGDISVLYNGTRSNVASIDARVAGFVGSGESNVAVEATRCLSAGTVSTSWEKKAGLTYSTEPKDISNVAGAFGYVTTTLTTKDVYDVTEVSKQVVGVHNTPAVVEVSSGKTPSTKIIRLNTSESLWTGLDACRYTTLDFTSEGNWAAVAGDFPRPKCFVDSAIALTEVESLVDFGWFNEATGAATSPFILNDSKDLYAFSLMSRVYTFNNLEVQLGADITVNNGTVATWENNQFAGLNNWLPITNFAGKFDGKGYSISGIYYITDAKPAGFFANMKASAVLNDFSLNNSYLVSTFAVDATIGAIAGSAAGTWNNISSNAKVVTTTGFKAGGLVGNAADNITLIGCSFSGDVVVNHINAGYGLYVGGLLGQVSKNLTMSECSFTGNVEATLRNMNASVANFFVGGFVGRTGSTSEVNITSSANDGTVSAYWVGAASNATFNYVDSLIGHSDKAPIKTEVTGESIVTKQVLQ